MTSAYELLAKASVWWWPQFADHLWQATIFALVLLAAVFVLRRGPARWRHTFCLLASAKFIVPVALFALLAQQTGINSLSFFHLARQSESNALLLYGIAEPAAALVSSYEVMVVANSAGRHDEIYMALTAVWLAGSFAILLLWGFRRRRFLRSLPLGQTVQQGREWQALEQARATLQWQGKVGLVISPLKIEPAVWRVWRPTVVLPESIAGQLDDDELEAIMLHELVHIQRRDNLVGNLQLALCALLWFHPLVWFLSRKLFDEREQACDERVMEVCRAPEAYASSILKVVRFCFGWRVAGVIGAVSGSNLRRRIENIMTIGNTRRVADGPARLLAGMLLGVALFILVGAGVYSRPRTVAAVARETGEVGTSSARVAVAEPGAEADKRSSKKTKQPPPPPAPPAESGVTVAPADSPQPPRPAEPAQPPAPPEEVQDSDKSDQDKSSKEKSKQKVKKGELIEAPQPTYPEEVKNQKIEGTVVVVITIGNDGNVIYAKAKSGPAELYGASEAAALKARFKPTLLEGKPVKVSGLMSYNFVLDKKE